MNTRDKAAEVIAETRCLRAASGPYLVSDALDRAGLLADPEIEEIAEDLSNRLSLLLDNLTDGLLSKDNYSVQTMVQQVEETFKKRHQADFADVWDEGAADGMWNAEHEAMIERGNREAILNPYRGKEEA